MHAALSLGSWREEAPSIFLLGCWLCCACSGPRRTLLQRAECCLRWTDKRKMLRLGKVSHPMPHLCRQPSAVALWQHSASGVS